MPKLLQAVLVVIGTWLGAELIFSVILGQPIPASLMSMYMFFIIVGVFTVFTFTDEGAEELMAPIVALVEDPSRKTVRNVTFVIVPVLAAVAAWNLFTPSLEAPLELRSIHPAPPSRVEAFGQTFDLLTLENPYRHLEAEDPEAFGSLVKVGARVYVENCHFCHGDKLDGAGPYAAGLNPVPLNFQDIGTIAQLQESYLFWRIATGGRGLPSEGAPWSSAMPAWQEYLTEEEIWSVILFLYDYTGHRPRTFAEE